ncbi:MAG: MinD/ParA family protein [Candidatus Brocadia sp.]|nr:MinD/ParA family protein [Candidatus Brocadia sp.]
MAAGFSKVRTIAVTSGKGGVGKTNIATNLAMIFRKYKKRVLLVDLDLGLANVDVLLGFHAKYTLHDVITGCKGVKDIIIQGPDGLMIVPASSGIEELTNLTEIQKELLFKGFSRLDEEIDIVIVDTGAGISSNVLSFVLAANEVLLVTTPEPTAITDAYAMIKVLSKKRNDLNIKLLVNLSGSREEAELTVKRITSVTRQFLDVNIEYFGYLLQDPNVPIATRRQKSFVKEYPNTIATSCLTNVASSFLKMDDGTQALGIEGYFRRIANERYSDPLSLNS